MNLPDPDSKFTIVSINAFFIGDKLSKSIEAVEGIKESEEFIKNRIDVNKFIVIACDKIKDNKIDRSENNDACMRIQVVERDEVIK
jgi:hypothetical protein